MVFSCIGTTKEVQRVDLGSSKSNKKEDFSKDLSMEGHAKKSPHFYASVACNIKSLLTATQDAKGIYFFIFFLFFFFFKIGFIIYCYFH